MMIDIDKIVENIEDSGAESVEYKASYTRDGEFYTLRIRVEKKERE